MKQDAGPGVPEALPRVLRMVGERLDPGTLDRIWIFPPLVRGRREWGLVAASRMVEGERGAAAPGEAPAPGPGPVGERRKLFSAPYMAERTGKGLHLDMSLQEQGEAPPDRLPRVMDGVVRRSGDELGDPREVEIAADPERFGELMEDFDPALFEETALPLQPTSET